MWGELIREGGQYREYRGLPDLNTALAHGSLKASGESERKALESWHSRCRWQLLIMRQNKIKGTWCFLGTLAMEVGYTSIKCNCEIIFSFYHLADLRSDSFCHCWLLFYFSWNIISFWSKHTKISKADRKFNKLGSSGLFGSFCFGFKKSTFRLQTLMVKSYFQYCQGSSTGFCFTLTRWD